MMNLRSLHMFKNSYWVINRFLVLASVLHLQMAFNLREILNEIMILKIIACGTAEANQAN